MILPSSLANLLCMVLGYIYPAYASFKTLDKKFEPDQYQRWLAYWVVFSAFSALELIGDVVIFWFPLYDECKIAFIAWLVLPYFNGSATIYKAYIGPWLEKYHPQIDKHVDRARGSMQSALDRVQKDGISFLKSKSSDILKTLSKQDDSKKEASGATTAAPAAAAPAAAAPAATEADEKKAE